jgi:peptide/nickel transport system substrate-binding protein
MKRMSRRAFMRYSLGLGGGVIFTSGFAGFLEAQGKKEPERGERIQKIIYTVQNRSDMTELGRIVATAFKEIGLEIQIETLELQALLSKLMGKHEAEMSAMTWVGSMDRIDPSFYLTDFYHSKNAIKGGRNYEHYRNPEYDRICDESNTEMDREKRISLVWKCQEILARDYPIWIIGFPDIVNAYNSQEWEGPVGMMGAGIGSDHCPWTWLSLKPKTARKRVVTANVLDLITFSLGTRSGNDRSILRLIYDTFLKLDPELKVVPWAASDWKVVDKRTVDITLRDRMKFHDGKPVTIEDVKFTFDYIQQKKMAMYKEVYDLIEKTEILADKRLRFHLVNPYAPFLPNTLTYAHILPKHVWEKIDEPDKYPNEKPIGSGPFKFGYWKRGEELYLEANKDHFYPPQNEGFYRKVIPTLEGIIAALENKEIDIQHDRIDSESAKGLEKFSHLTVVSTPSHGVYELRGDLDKRPFSDLQFRKAMSYAIPRKQYMAQIFGKAGHASPNSIIHPQLKPWHNGKVGFDEYSLQNAKDILKTAGYWWDRDGFLHYPK